MYAPVVLRLRSYGAVVWPDTRQYLERVLADGFMQERLAAAAAEPWTADTEAVGLYCGRARPMRNAAVAMNTSRRKQSMAPMKLSIAAMNSASIA